MSKANKAFGKIVTAQKDALIKNAEVHKETHHIGFKLEEYPEGITPESLASHTNFINQSSLAVEAATFELGTTHFADTKHEAWDGRLELAPGVIINSSAHLREVVGEDTLYGTTQSYVDHPHSQDMVDWYASFRDTNMERAKKLFDK